MIPQFDFQRSSFCLLFRAFEIRLHLSLNGAHKHKDMITTYAGVVIHLVRDMSKMPPLQKRKNEKIQTRHFSAGVIFYEIMSPITY